MPTTTRVRCAQRPLLYLALAVAAAACLADHGIPRALAARVEPACFESLAPATAEHFSPKDPAAPLTLPQLTGGEWSLPACSGTGSGGGLTPDPVLFVLYDKSYGPASLVWESPLKDLIAKVGPDGHAAHFVFISYSNSTDEVASQMKEIYTRHQADLDATSRGKWEPKLHYITAPARSTGTWLSDWIKDWTAKVTGDCTGQVAAAAAVSGDSRSLYSEILKVYDQRRTDRQSPFHGRAQAAVEPGPAGLPGSTVEPLLLAVDRLCRIREVGVGGVGLADLNQYVQYYDYEASITQATSQPGVRELRVWTQGADRVRQNLTSHAVPLPTAAELAASGAMWIELDLGCDGHRSKNCGPWDYVLDLYLDAPGVRNLTRVARWITPYQREGRWLTDISPVLGLMASLRRAGVENVTLSLIIDWRQEYNVGLSFWFGAAPNHLVGNSAVPVLFEQVAKVWGMDDTPDLNGSLDGHYNARRRPATVTVPPGVGRLELVAEITGHGFGYDDRNCAEFCNIEHTFRVQVEGDPTLLPEGGRDVLAEGDQQTFSFPNAGTDAGCAGLVGQGVVPDQAGTWPYGRNGWCPGMDVKWVTRRVAVTPPPKGARLSIAYTTAYNGTEYQPEGGAKGIPFLQVDTFLVGYSEDPNTATTTITTTTATTTTTNTDDAAGAVAVVGTGSNHAGPVAVGAVWVVGEGAGESEVLI